MRLPNNYHIEYDGHYYSVLYSYCGKPAILKATALEIRICDQYNRLICTHKRSYRAFPLYITLDEHMPPEHLYYKEVNSKDGNYYLRWASAIGPAMSELIDRLLKSSKHEEQSYNACAGILHKVKVIPKGVAEEAEELFTDSIAEQLLTDVSIIRYPLVGRYLALFREHELLKLCVGH